jgi:hypothetical protein
MSDSLLAELSWDNTLSKLFIHFFNFNPQHLTLIPLFPVYPAQCVVETLLPTSMRSPSLPYPHTLSAQAHSQALMKLNLDPNAKELRLTTKHYAPLPLLCNLYTDPYSISSPTSSDPTHTSPIPKREARSEKITESIDDLKTKSHSEFYSYTRTSTKLTRPTQTTQPNQPTPC